MRHPHFEGEDPELDAKDAAFFLAQILAGQKSLELRQALQSHVMNRMIILMSDTANSLSAVLDSVAVNEAAAADKIKVLTDQNAQLRQSIADLQAASPTGTSDADLQAMIDKVSPNNDVLAAQLAEANA